MRTRGTRAGRLAAAAMVAFGLVAGPAAADAKQARAAETALSAQAPTVTIIASTPVLTSPEAVLTVTARVSNETGRAWVGDVNLSVAAKAFADRAELAAWPEQSLDQWPGTTWVAKGLSRRLEAGQTETYEITSTAAAMALGGADGEPGWGPRGIEVGLETTRGTVAIARTFVVYAPPAEIGGGLNLSVVAGLTAGPGETREQALTRLGRVAAASADSSVAWVVDPALLVADQTDSDATAEDLAAAIGRAAEAGKAVYLLPYEDLDEAALAPAGASGQALVAAARRLGKQALSDAAGEVAAARLSGNLAWAARPIDQAAVDFSVAAGADAILLDAAQFAAPPVQAVSKQLAQPAIISCDEFWTAALAGVASPSQTIRLLAESALMAGRAQAEGYQASAVVAMPRDWQPEAIGWPAFDQLSAASWVNTAPLPAALNAAVDSAPGLAAAGDSGIAAASLTALVELTDRMAAFASLTQDPDAYLARSLPPLLAPLSNAVAESNRAAQAAAALNQAATAAAPLAVKVGSDVNLISDDGRVPVVVENRSNEAVRGLVVRLTARTRAIQLGEPVSLDLEPDQAGTARVPVHAVANGVFRVQVDLLDSSGQPVAEGASLTMRVQAEWEDVGMAVVSGVLALALVFGVFTTVRKRRAEARSQADRAGPAAPAGPAGPGSAA